MTPTNRSISAALIACGLMTASCAGLRLTSAVAPPRLSLPTAAARPCDLARLPDQPTIGDLEAAYALRGAHLLACDAARRLAVETLVAERALVDRWLKITP